MSSCNEQKLPPISLIREECKHLQEVESLMTDIWQCELQAYEHHDDWTVPASCDSALDKSASSSYGGQRNHPNIDGVIANTMMFPYHNALYPLLDCYDSIKQDEDISNINDVIPPSKAPDPFSHNGYRRSKFSPRLDPLGFHIGELEFLEGHLPNSAIAIRETLMPFNRRVEHLQYISDTRAEPDEVVEAVEALEDHTAFSRPRFWKILMNQKTKLGSSNVSLAPGDEGIGEDTEEDLQMAKNARDFSFLSWWENEIKSNKPLTLDLESKITASTPTLSLGEYSVESLFAASPDDASLLILRVLKHAMSELQRDFKLARAILLLIADLHLIDDESTRQLDSNDGIETLRRLLSIVSSEYIYCTGSCHEWYLANGGIHNGAPETADDESIDLDETSNEESNDDREHYNNGPLNDSQNFDSLTHYCTDWFQLLGSVSTVIANGIQFMTQQHITVICAFVVREIDAFIGTFNTGISGDDSKNGSESTKGNATYNDKPHSSRYKGYIKQNLFMFKNSDFDEQAISSQSKPSRQLRVNLLVALVNGLKKHAFVQRMRLEKQIQDWDAVLMKSSSEQDSLKQTLAVFNTCVEALVDIGERIVFNLPANNQTCLLGGTVVRALLEIHLESEVVSEIDEDQLYVAQNANIRFRSIIDPLRYADAISNASTNTSFNPDCSRKKSSDLVNPELISSYIDQPSQDVQDVVKALFVRDIVDLRISGFGWGDFSVWFRLPISPCEPHIFLVHKNFPNIDDSGEIWVTDEEGQDLDHTSISAHVDFSLMLLLREWNKPWTPGSHLSYSAPFRSAVKELALCAHRFGVPSDIVASVNSFLQRTWWPDERSTCWCRNCQFVKLRDRFRSKLTTRKSNWNKYKEAPFTQSQHHSNVRPNEPLQLMTCKCSVALACSKEHLRHVNQEGHKRYCGFPPYRALTEDDDAFIREVLVGEDDGKLDDEGNDGEDDWESVNSDEADSFENISMSHKIRRYFEHHSYRHMRREALPFQDFF